MSCQKFKSDMLDYLAGSKNMPGYMQQHMSECTQCKEKFLESQKALEHFLEDEEFDAKGYTPVETYININMPGLNKKAAQLQDYRQKRIENIVYAAMVTAFVGLIMFILKSFFYEYNPWPLTAAFLYMIFASIVSVLIIPQYKKEV